MGNGLDIDHNYTILDVLIATPFDKRFNLNGKLDTISFFKYLFIENQSFQEMKESLEEFISTIFSAIIGPFVEDVGIPVKSSFQISFPSK